VLNSFYLSKFEYYFGPIFRPKRLYRKLKTFITFFLWFNAQMKPYPLSKKIGFISGPLFCTLILGLPFDLVNSPIDTVIAIATWMIIWWVTEAVSISVTALILLTLFPLLGMGTIKEVASNYANPIVYLFFGGFVIALALEKVQLHKRIAFSILKITGTKANGINVYYNIYL